jgi:SAM domain (Sterile alpha motif)
MIRGAAAMQQVADWLGNLGLGQYAQRFAENGIDVSVLRYLTDHICDPWAWFTPRNSQVPDSEEWCTVLTISVWRMSVKHDKAHPEARTPRR